jgi:hypothetical protein
MAPWGKLFAIIFGLLFLALGVILGVFGAADARAEAARAEALAPLNAAALDDRAPGETALVAGALSPRNRALFRDYVAYTVEEYRGEDDSNDDPEWEREAEVTPPLLIEAGGIVRVANEDYRIEGALTRWQESQVLTWNGFSGEGTKRYAGLVAGQPVTTIGAVVAGAEENELRAEVVFGGTQAQYVAAQRQSAFMLPIIGGIFGAIGLIVAGVGAWLLLRR